MTSADTDETPEQRISELEAQLEHAKAALAGDNEGIRLWMLDCGALVEKHRKRANEALDADWQAEAERWKLNARRMALLAEAFVYEPRRITESGLIAQIHRVLTDQDVEWAGDNPA